MSEPAMEKIMGDGIEIQVAEWGGNGKAILAVHGLTANCRVWDTIADAVTPANRFLAMDLRGRGLSDKPDKGYSIDHHCRDIKALLANLGLERIILMGHSLGAFIALVFSARYPELVDKIILVDGGGKLSTEQTAKVFKGIKPSLDRLGQVFPSFEAYLDLMKQTPFLTEWSQALEIFYQHEIEDAESGIRSRVHPDHIQEEILSNSTLDISETYPKIVCPVLILRATEGMMAPDDILLPEDALERILKEIPAARWIDLEGTNHYTIVFQPNDARDKALIDFLKD